MDTYTIRCTDLLGAGRSAADGQTKFQAKADSLQKTLDKITKGDYKASDIGPAVSAQSSLKTGIARLAEIGTAMGSASAMFSESSAELSARANLTAYYMEHTDTLSYEGLMGAFSSAIVSSGSAAAGYELVKSSLKKEGYSVGSLGSVSNAVQDALKRAEEQAKREKQAKWAKIGLTGLVIVGGIAATLLTGGAAAPILIGAASGAIMAGGNTAIDQYAEHGWEMGSWDYGAIGKDAFIGGVSGAATAWIGGNVTKYATSGLSNMKFVSAGLNSSSSFVRVGTGAFIGSTTEVVSGVATRGGGEFISTMMETGNVSQSFKESVKTAFDGKQMLKDAALGGTMGGKMQQNKIKTENAAKAAQTVAPGHSITAGTVLEGTDEFAPGVPMIKRDGRSDVFAAGDHFDDYCDWETSNSLNYVESNDAGLTFVSAKDIEGVNLGQSEFNNGSFWNNGNGFSQEAIFDQASKIPEVREQLNMGKSLSEIAQDPNLAGTVGSYFKGDPVVVYKYGEFYIHAGNGRHRTLAGQSMDVDIPVKIIGEYFNK